MERINPGDDIRADFLNRLGRAADSYYQQSHQGNASLQQFPSFGSHVETIVSNLTGYDLRRGEVIEIDGAIFSGDQNANALWLKAATPDLSRVGYGIMLEPVPYADPRKGGRCLLVGLCLAHVNMINASHDHARLVNGSRVLESSTSGPIRIYHTPGGTGEKECIVLIGFEGLKVYLGKTAGALNKGTTGPVIRHKGGDETPFDPEVEDQVRNLYTDLPDDAWVHYVDVDGTFYALAGECDA